MVESDCSAFCEWLKGHLMVSEGPVSLHTTLALFENKNWWHVWKGSGLQVWLSASQLLHDWDWGCACFFFTARTGAAALTHKKGKKHLKKNKKKDGSYMNNSCGSKKKKKTVLLWSPLISSASAECKHWPWGEGAKKKKQNKKLQPIKQVEAKRQQRCSSSDSSSLRPVQSL